MVKPVLGAKKAKVDREALAELIKDIKKNTKLSDEDAAVLAASKVKKISYVLRKLCLFFFYKVVDSQPKSRMWYRIGATKSITGGRKITPSVKSEKLRQVRNIIRMREKSCF